MICQLRPCIILIMDKDELMIEEFKQAGTEYTFFQELALKYLAFYTAILGVIITAFIAISTVKFENVTKVIIDFLRGPFLSLCGLFLLFIGTIVAFLLLKCRDKAITSIKSLMCTRKSISQNVDFSIFKDDCYHALAVPRHYKFLSPTQGIILVIAAINSIAFASIYGFKDTGMNGLIQLFNLGNGYGSFIIISCLTFMQYLLVYNYMIRKDIVKVNLNFNPEQNIKEVKLEYDVPRAITNSSLGCFIARIMFYLTGLTEEEIAFFKKRRARKFVVENNVVKLKKLIAGHYKIIAPGTNKKDLLIFGDIYEEFTDTIEFQPADQKLYNNIKEKPQRHVWFLSELTRNWKEAINTIIRYSFFFLIIIYMLIRWKLFMESKVFWTAVIFLVIHFLFVLGKPFCKYLLKRKKVKQQTQVDD